LSLLLETSSASGAGAAETLDDGPCRWPGGCTGGPNARGPPRRTARYVAFGTSGPLVN
jgi:hypothetical protein